jgi:hypothetical protein
MTNLGRARMQSQSRQFCGACEAGVEHSREECDAVSTQEVEER